MVLVDRPSLQVYCHDPGYNGYNGLASRVGVTLGQVVVDLETLFANLVRAKIPIQARLFPV
jgi:hypothetical protein